MIRIVLLVLSLAAAHAAQAESRIPQTQTEISLGFAPLVKKAAPAVVNIYARRVVAQRRTPFMNDPFFEDFFRSFSSPQPRVQNSLGSGVTLSADGIVVSNYHVVDSATDIRVVLSDRREFSARVLLGDRESDLAVLQLEGASDLPFLELRNSDQVEVGELVMAIGNPFGIGQTVTSGIVSGLARSGAATGQERGYFIQTDAAINPGNSGGALIDVNASLIGINTSILSRSGGSNGIGFAIPANLVAEFVYQARQGAGRFERPWAGMSGQPVNSDLAESLGLAVPDGIVITELHRVSPFALAGLGVGDVITHVDGQPVNSPAEMLFRMTVAGIGEEALVTWMHDTEQKNTRVAMTLAPDDPPAEELRLSEATVLPDLTVARANPAIIARYGLPLTTMGMVITNPGPLGARVGVQTGDVIRAVNGEDMHSSADVEAALTRPGRRVSLDLMRRGQRLSLRFRL